MESRRIATDTGRYTVRIDGPESQRTVLLLPDAGDPATVYDAVCRRLHNSGLRTVAVESSQHLTVAGVHAVLDALGLSWVDLVGNGAGAELCWSVAADGFGRFASLVVVDRAHPAVPDEHGEAPEPDCGPVELPTTLLTGGVVDRTRASLTGRQVFAEYRVVRLDGVRHIPTGASHELATEIVLRTSAG